MYGNKIIDYPVAHGSVWKFDKGIFVCGSSAFSDSWRMIPQVESVYTDPPWDEGNMKMFYTFAHKKNSQNHVETIVSIFNNLKSRLRPFSPVFYDMGVKRADTISQELYKIGFVTKAMVNTYYGSPKKECRTGYGYFGDGEHISLSIIQDRHGVDVIKGVISLIAKSGAKSVIDPCCGKLDFLIEGIKQGIDNVYGIELIPEKLAYGLYLIEKLGYKVERIA